MSTLDYIKTGEFGKMEKRTFIYRKDRLYVLIGN